MLQIYLHGETESGFLDLLPGTVLEREAITDLFDEDLSTGEFTLPVEIPWTDGNRRKMNFAERIENFNQKLHYWVCDVYANGFPEMINAKIVLLEKEGVLSYKKGKFSASISGTKGLFGTAIKNKKLRDMKLGGVIDWSVSDPLFASREFADYVMKGWMAGIDMISFAPVAIENFFDESKNYTDEFLVKDTVNYIMRLDGGPLSWEFGRPSSIDETIRTFPGEREYIDFRTVPFYKFKFIFKKVIEELGYTVSGEIMDTADFNDAHIFNNQSIEFYSMPALADFNRKIVPADHVPDIYLIDFFRAVFSAFNIYPVFNAYHIELKYRKKIFKDKRVLDITDRCDPNFTSTFKDANESSGYTLEYQWDEADDYRNDRVKDITKKNLVATVATLPNLTTLDIGRPFTTDDIVLVESENMYYNVANATVTPVLWDAWSERLDSYKKGDGGRTVNIGLGTLCTYVEYVEAEALSVNRYRVGTRQPGSYTTNTYHTVKSPFSLRLFYIKTMLVDGRMIPVSFNHNTSRAGSVLEKYSLALDGPFGLKSFHEEWQDLQEGNEIVKVKVKADKKLTAEMEACNVMQIEGIQFLIQKFEDSIPLDATITQYLVPL